MIKEVRALIKYNQMEKLRKEYSGSEDKIISKAKADKLLKKFNNNPFCKGVYIKDKVLYIKNEIAPGMTMHYTVKIEGYIEPGIDVRKVKEEDNCRYYEQLEDTMLIKKLLFKEITEPIFAMYTRRYKDLYIEDIYYSLVQEVYVVKYTNKNTNESDIDVYSEKEVLDIIEGENKR